MLVDWDGFDADYLARAQLPNLRRLVERGSLTIASSTFHTVSDPARASMSTGAYPEIHDNAAYYFDPIANAARGQERFLAAETIAEALAAEGRTIASVQWYMVQNHGTGYGDPEHLYVQPGGDFGRRVDLAEMDDDLGRLVQATKDVGIYGETAFLLTSDHGMTSWSRTLLPQLLATISAAGYRAEVVTPGRSPAADSEVIVVPNAVRQGDITLRGRAATADGREDVRSALQSLSPTYIADVLDESDHRALRASRKLGDLTAEAQPPYGFALSEPAAGEQRGSHGSRAELQVPLLLAGAGIRRGVNPRDPVLVDVAPTIAALLGTRPPAQAQGRVLGEALGPAAPQGAAGR